MTNITCPYFTESVLCEMDGDYMIAQGWTASTGQTTPWEYTLQEGWIFDQRYSDIRGKTGSHGGCPGCVMTLVHLISIDPVEDTYYPPEEPEQPIDPIHDMCDGVVCQDECFGSDLWSQVCVSGYCVQHELIESDSQSCMYDEGGEDWYDFIVDNAGYILLFTVAGAAVTKFVRE